MNIISYFQIIFFICFFTLPSILISQTLESDIDSLKKLLKTVKEDTNKVLILRDISWNYKSSDHKKSMYYAFQCLNLANKVGNKFFIGKAYSNLGSCYYNQGDYVNAENNYRQALKIGEEIHNKMLIAGCMNSIGNVYGEKSDYAKSIEYHLKALKLLEEIGEKERIAHILLNLGASYQELKNSKMALIYFSKALIMLKESENRYALSKCYANIGGIFIEKNEFNKAEDNFTKSKEIYEELGDTLGISHSYYSLGMIYKEKKMNDKALEYFFTALKLGKQLNDNAWVAEYLLSIGQIYRKIKNYKEALNFLNQSLKLSDLLSSKFLKKEIHREFAETYHKMSEQTNLPDSSIKYLKKAYNHFEMFSIFKDSAFNKESSKQIAEMQTKYDTEKKDTEIKLLNKDKEIQDSNLKKQRILIFSFLTGFILILVFSVFLYRLFLQKKKANIIIALKNQSLEIAYSEINNQKEEITTQRDEIETQRNTVTKQKEQIEEIYQEISDSINYAKRIQVAVLPDLSVIARCCPEPVEGAQPEAISDDKIASLPLAMTAISTPRNFELFEYFVLFKPKDIVSGDFYWATKITGSPQSSVNNPQTADCRLSIADFLIVTVADCTGHGVPGAFMSMLGISFINEIVRKKEVTKASDVLDQLRTSVIDALKQKGESSEQKDGMDIALCAINMDTLEMQFAGANNPCYIIAKMQPVIAMAQPEANSTAQSDCFVPRNDEYNFVDPVIELVDPVIELVDQVIELVEIKGDKQPIGIHSNMQPFTNQIYQLQKGDIIYLMSDGYEDQFGGPNRKKFLAKNLKNLLIANSQLPIADQKQILETTITEWIGNGEQIDDITVMGIKI